MSAALRHRPAPTTLMPDPGLLEALPNATLVLDPETLTVRAGNTEAVRLLRTSREELPAVFQQALEAAPALAEGLLAPDGMFDCELRLADGRRHEAQMRCKRVSFGPIERLVVTVIDTTRRRNAENARALLLRELDHRVRNLFAVIAGLVTFTARGAGTAQEMRATLLGRIDALARAHDLVKLAIGGGFAAAEAMPHHTTLAVLAEALVGPLRGDEPARLRIEGPEVGIGGMAAAPLALVLHELATNAARHGALASPEGRLALHWAHGPAGTLRLAWEESCPAAPQPPSPGIGQRLVTQSLLQLGGEAQFDWQPDGLRVAITLPLARLDA